MLSKILFKDKVTYWGIFYIGITFELYQPYLRTKQRVFQMLQLFEILYR